MASRKKAGEALLNLSEGKGEPQRIDVAQVRQIRAAAAAPAKIVTRTFYLDGPNGEPIEVKVKGAIGSYKLQSTNNALAITSGDERVDLIQTMPAVGGSERKGRVARREPERSGNAKEPGGTVEESLPGDDDIAEESGRQIERETLDFLRNGEKALMRKTKE